MVPMTEGFRVLEHNFLEWAQQEDGIRSAFVLGSRARADHPADESSDLDIAILAENPQVYLNDTAWIEGIGHPWLTFTERTGTGPFWERRVLFAGGYDVDFAFLPIAAVQEVLAGTVPPDLASIVHRGVRLVLDKDGLAERFLSAAPPPAAVRPPAREEYLNLVNDFWYHAVWTAKKLQRGELWTAKSCSDNYMKWRLLSLIEWHARANHGPHYDTWHGGRYLEEWADQEVLEGLRGAYSSYEEDSLWRGLFATMSLFHRLAVEIAQHLGYPYPLEGEAHATQMVFDIHRKCTRAAKIPSEN